MDVSAKARFIRMTPRKVRLVVDLIRGLSVEAADAQLSFLGRRAAMPVLKLLRSAVANAEHNYQMNRTDLRVKTITVDAGPTEKRVRPRAFGRAATIRKRMSHIAMTLSDGKEAQIPSVNAAATTAPVATITPKTQPKARTARKTAPKNA